MPGRPLTRRQHWSHPNAPAVTMGAGAVAALMWSALRPLSYRQVVHDRWWGHFDLFHVVSQGLMTIFFLSIGLELARRWRSDRGHVLSSSTVALSAAVGGMAATAGISLVLSVVMHSATLRQGWSIPMATDIAFTLSALALAGRRVPDELRLLLLSIALADDVLSVVVLAVVGKHHLHVVALVEVAIGVILALLLRRVFHGWVYVVTLTPLMALLFARADIETLLAGALVGVLMPDRAPRDVLVEPATVRLSVLMVLPLFSFVACGLQWSRIAHGAGSLIFAVVGIRILGKIVGISAGVAFAGWRGASLAPTISRPMVIAAGTLCAIGFTVPLIFASELFGAQSPTYNSYAAGLELASLLGAVLGGFSLRILTRRDPSPRGN